MKVRKIRIESWTEPSTTKPGERIDVDTCILVRNMVRGVPVEKIPRGVEAFELMKSLHEALKDAENQEYLMLTENVFQFLEDNCFDQIPATWGLMEELSNAVTLLVGAELVEVKLEESELAREETTEAKE